MLWTWRWRAFHLLRSCHILCPISIWQYERQTYFPCAAFGPVQWSRLLWCRGRKKLWVQKKGSEGKARLTSCRETDRVRMHWFQLKAVEAVIQKPQSMGQSSHTKELLYLFKCGGTWVFLALTVLYSSTKTTAFSKVVCCQHFATHMVLTPTCFAPPPPLRTGVFPAKRYLWPRKLGIIILNSRGLPFPFCIYCCTAGSIRISIPIDWDQCVCFGKHSYMLW